MWWFVQCFNNGCRQNKGSHLATPQQTLPRCFSTYLILPTIRAREGSARESCEAGVQRPASAHDSTEQHDVSEESNLYTMTNARSECWERHKCNLTDLPTALNLRMKNKCFYFYLSRLERRLELLSWVWKWTVSDYPDTYSKKREKEEYKRDILTLKWFGILIVFGAVAKHIAAPSPFRCRLDFVSNITFECHSQYISAVVSVVFWSEAAFFLYQMCIHYLQGVYFLCFPHSCSDGYENERWAGIAARCI